ncbi:MAG: hypothetical protein F6K28_06265 [Microcoleus sp. SIO2G3]|nr:hypothetical protein [Microcoleus sp. SIO2G3]
MANATPNGERHAKGVSERECVCLWHSAPPEEARQSPGCRETPSGESFGYAERKAHATRTRAPVA